MVYVHCPQNQLEGEMLEPFKLFAIDANARPGDAVLLAYIYAKVKAAIEVQNNKTWNRWAVFLLFCGVAGACWVLISHSHIRPGLLTFWLIWMAFWGYNTSVFSEDPEKKLLVDTRCSLFKDVLESREQCNNELVEANAIIAMINQGRYKEEEFADYLEVVRHNVRAMEAKIEWMRFAAESYGKFGTCRHQIDFRPTKIVAKVKPADPVLLGAMSIVPAKADRLPREEIETGNVVLLSHPHRDKNIEEA